MFLQPKASSGNLLNPIVEKKSLNSYEVTLVYAVVCPNPLHYWALVPPDVGSVGCSQLSPFPEVAISWREPSCPKSGLLPERRLNSTTIDCRGGRGGGILVTRYNFESQPCWGLYCNITIQLLPSSVSLTLLRCCSQAQVRKKLLPANLRVCFLRNSTWNTHPDENFSKCQAVTYFWECDSKTWWT